MTCADAVHYNCLFTLKMTCADVYNSTTGTELGLAVDAAKELEKDGKTVRVVSMVSWELFEEQGKDYKASGPS